MAVRLLRGRALVQVDESEYQDVLKNGVIRLAPQATWLNESRRDGLRIHRGKVVSLGPPAFEHPGVERPWHCKPGDEVLYVYASLEKNRMFDGWKDFERVAVVAQEEIQAVIE